MHFEYRLVSQRIFVVIRKRINLIFFRVDINRVEHLIVLFWCSEWRESNECHRKLFSDSKNYNRILQLEWPLHIKYGSNLLHREHLLVISFRHFFFHRFQWAQFIRRIYVRYPILCVWHYHATMPNRQKKNGEKNPKQRDERHFASV